MSVKIKRLEWESTRYGETEACTPFGFFKVRHENGGDAWGTFHPLGDGFVDGFVPERGKPLEYAKSVCQAWFDALVLECLEVGE